MSYEQMTQARVFREIDTEDKARAWFWRERFAGKAFECPACGEEGSFWQHVSTPEIRQCASCLHVVRLRAAGLLRDSKLPLLTWARALLMLTADKRGVAALTLQRQLELGSYRTALLLLRKVRSAFAERDKAYRLSGTVELDGAHIGSRAADNQASALVAIESDSYTTKNGTVRKKAGFAKCIVADETVTAGTAFLKEAVSPEAMINSDASSALSAIKGFDTEQRVMNGDKDALQAWLPQAFHFFENAKVWIVGTFHGVSKKYLPQFLAEYTYRFNRRHDQNGLFHRALRACMLGTPATAQMLCA